MRFAELDYLRGFAALAVVGFHFLYLGPSSDWMVGNKSDLGIFAARYGYLGVHLFFMISGFVIMMSAQGATVRDFFISRFARLAPAMWICATLTSLTIVISQTSLGSVSWFKWVANLTLVPHWFGVGPIDGAYWSLVVEIHFYLAVGILIYLRQLKKVEQILYFWLVVSLVNYLRPMHPIQLFLNANWAPLLCAGSLLFFVKKNGWNKSRLIGLGVCFVLALLYELRSLQSSYSEIRWTACFILGFLFFLFAYLSTANLGFKSTKLSRFLGEITYPLYLLHQTIGYVLFNSHFAKGLIEDDQLRISVIAIALVGMAWIIHRRIEKPLARTIKKMFQNSQKPLTS